MNQDTETPGLAPQGELGELATLFQTHGKQVGLSIALAVAALLAIVIYRHYHQTRAQRTAALLTSHSIQDLETLVYQYPSSPTVPLGLLKLAKTYFDNGSYDVALNKYTEFLTRFPKDALTLVADVGRIHCLEARNQTDEALAQFKEFALKNPNHYLMPQAVLGEARCLEQLHRLADAKALCEEFIARHPDNGWTPRVEEVLSELNLKIEKNRTDGPASPNAVAPAKP